MCALTAVKFSQLAVGGRLLGAILPNLYGFDIEGEGFSVENRMSDPHSTLLLWLLGQTDKGTGRTVCYPLPRTVGFSSYGGRDGEGMTGTKILRWRFSQS